MSPNPSFRTAFAIALTVLAVAPAAAVDYPTLKNGQWEMSTTNSPGSDTPRKSTLCLDAATQKAMLDMGLGMQKEMCTRMDIRRDGQKYITDAECKVGPSVMKSHGVMTMMGDSAYRTESSATFDPPLAKDMRETKTVIEGKYIGACRDGMQPGDMIMANGQKININQMQRPPGPPKAK